MTGTVTGPLTERVGALPPNIDAKIRRTATCWAWLGAIRHDGYGMAYLKGRQERAHRAVWRFLVGDIPAGLELDHLCRNRWCVNPSHLEAVTRRTNMLRGEHRSAVTHRTDVCQRGHSNWRSNGADGKRTCETCRLWRRYGQPLTEQGML